MSSKLEFGSNIPPDLKKETPPAITKLFTLKTGLIKDIAGMYSAFGEKSWHPKVKLGLEPYTKWLLDNLPLGKEQKYFEVLEVTPEQLGLKKNASRKEIYEAARLSGLAELPADLTPQIALAVEEHYQQKYQYTRTKLDYFVGTQPLLSYDQKPLIFNISRSPDHSPTYIHSGNGEAEGPNAMYSPNQKWLFGLEVEKLEQPPEHGQ